MNDINSECWVIHGMDFMAHSALTSAQNLGTSIVFLGFFSEFRSVYCFVLLRSGLRATETSVNLVAAVCHLPVHSAFAAATALQQLRLLLLSRHNHYYMLRKSCILKPRIRGSFRDLNFPRKSREKIRNSQLGVPRTVSTRVRISLGRELQARFTPASTAI